MAQLPPKVPTMTQNWPPFPPHQQRLQHPSSNTMLPPPPTTTTTTHHHHPLWVDEFLDFTSLRRGAHRRSMSDSIAFLEMPVECRDSFVTGINVGGFDRLDDEQLMKMFSDDVGACGGTLPGGGGGGCCSDPTSSSDQNSNNNTDQDNCENNKGMVMMDNGMMEQCNQEQMMMLVQPKAEPGEVDSSCKNEEMQCPPLPFNAAANDPVNIDPKRVKRILANRQSAQRSRVRKLQYISELERTVTSLQTEVSALSPRVAFLDHQRLILNVDNSALKQRIAALAQDKIFKDAHREALKKEIERLRQLYHQQSLKKMDDEVAHGELPPATAPPSSEDLGWTEKEQLITT
ncbi:Basic leucine zipper 61-like protein [Drosera capensis]